jgi:hypothetical protein
MVMGKVFSNGGKYLLEGGGRKFREPAPGSHSMGKEGF